MKAFSNQGKNVTQKRLDSDLNLLTYMCCLETSLWLKAEPAMTLSLESWWSLYACLHYRCCVPFGTRRCEPARLMAQWVNEREDKAAFMAYACSLLHTYSLRGSFHHLISHWGISVHLIPPGIYFSRQERRSLCGRSLPLTKFIAQPFYLHISLLKIQFPEGTQG